VEEARDFKPKCTWHILTGVFCRAGFAGRDLLDKDQQILLFVWFPQCHLKILRDYFVFHYWSMFEVQCDFQQYDNVFAYVFGDSAYVDNKKCFVIKVGYDKNDSFVLFHIHVVTSLWFMSKDTDERHGDRTWHCAR
jgi:hypothetical protein